MQQQAHLGRAEDQNGPAGLNDGVTAAGSSLNLLDLAKSPVHAGSEVLVDVLEVLDDTNLVTVAGEECCDLLVVHRSVDGTLRDLEAVDVHDRQDRARLGRVDVLVAVPRGGSGTGLGLTVTNDASDDEVGLVHDGTEGHAQSVAELTTLVDGSGGLSVDVTGAVVRNEANMELRK